MMNFLSNCAKGAKEAERHCAGDGGGSQESNRESQGDNEGVKVLLVMVMMMRMRMAMLMKGMRRWRRAIMRMVE